jgi:hypothetical protein
MPLSRRKIRALLRKWQRIFYLRDWRITVQANEDESWENLAVTGVQEGRREAIMIYWDLLAEKDYEDVTIHELQHIIMHPIDELLSEWLEELPEEKRALFEKQLRNRIEVVVDNYEEIFKSLKL